MNHQFCAPKLNFKRSLWEHKLFDTEKRRPKAIKKSSRGPSRQRCISAIEQLSYFLNISRHFGILGQVQSFVPELVLFWTNSRMLLRKCDLIYLCLQEGCLCHPSFISLNLDHLPPPTSRLKIRRALLHRGIRSSETIFHPYICTIIRVHHTAQDIFVLGNNPRK